MQPEIELALPHRTEQRFTVSLARTRGEIREAQQLRYQVFVEEMGAHLTTREPGLDQDHFDSFCDHLLVRDEESLRVVGTYRLLKPSNAMRIGAFYADSEFDLVRLQHLRPYTVEVGRACIHPDYRSGGVIMLLWSGLARFMLDNRYDYLIGCASIPMNDGGANAAAVYRQIAEKYLAPIEYRVTPRNRFSLESFPSRDAPRVPPLLKGYLRLGAWIGGEPAWDPDFNTADLLVLLPLARVETRYARHYLGMTAEASTREQAPLGG